VYEQLIWYTPVGGGLVIVPVVDLVSWLSRFLRYLVVAGLLGLVAPGVIVFVGVALVIMIVKPIVKTREKINDLSAGEGDKDKDRTSGSALR